MAKIPKSVRHLVLGGEEIKCHAPVLCKGRACVFHKPSDHSMREWNILIRFDRLGCLAERICMHGIGHPDPDSLSFIESILPENKKGYEGIHGCDGCCNPQDQVARFRNDPE